MLRRSRKCSNKNCFDRYLLEKISKGKYKCVRCGTTVLIPEKKPKEKV